MPLCYRCLRPGRCLLRARLGHLSSPFKLNQRTSDTGLQSEWVLPKPEHVLRMAQTYACLTQCIWLCVVGVYGQAGAISAGALAFHSGLLCYETGARLAWSVLVSHEHLQNTRTYAPLSCTYPGQDTIGCGQAGAACQAPLLTRPGQPNLTPA